MRPLLPILLCAITGAHAALPSTAPGALDPGYGTGGMQVQDFDTGYDYGYRIVRTGDGRHVVFGYSQVGGIVSRVTAGGQPDVSFNGSGRRLLHAPGKDALSVYAGAVLPEGKVLAGGTYYVDDNSSYGYLTRLNADGSTDSAWGSGGEVRVNSPSAPYAAFRSVAVGADGAILAAGVEAPNASVPFRGLLIRLTAAGQVDPAFGVNGRAVMPAGFTQLDLRALRIAPTGKIVVAGFGRSGAATNNDGVVLRFNADGTLDAGFGSAGVYTYGEPGRTEEFRDLAITPDGGLVAAGHTYLGADYVGLAVKLGPSGLPDPGFNGNGVFRISAAGSATTILYSVAIASGGRIVLGGARRAGQDFQCVVLRRQPDGAPDGGFGSSGVSTAWNNERCIVNDVVVDPDDKITVAGLYRPLSSNAPDATMVARVLGSEITTTVVEFHNGPLDHYFITADPNEAAAIDGGAAGPGWSRTGQTFKSGGPDRVCRFYGSPEPDPATGLRRGPNSHFYTIDSAECAAVKTDAGWRFESYDFNGWPLAGGACPAGTLPVKRVYNGRNLQNDSNHRYVTTDALYAQMTAQGWRGEGTVFCAAP